MIIDHNVMVEAPADRVWELMMDIRAVMLCVPGVESFAVIDADTYEGTLRVKIGPIGVTLQGRVVVAERDEENLCSHLDISAVEKRIASIVRAKTKMTLVPRGEQQTELQIHTQATILGKLGEFGQDVMRRKVDQLMQEFARNVSRELTSG